MFNPPLVTVMVLVEVIPPRAVMVPRARIFFAEYRPPASITDPVPLVAESAVPLTAKLLLAVMFVALISPPTKAPAI